MSQEAKHHALNAVKRLAFGSYLRTGQGEVDSELLAAVAETEFKFNPYHDPRNGRFTFAPGGGVGGAQVRRLSSGHGNPEDRVSRYYRGVTSSGLGKIKPTSGGHFDTNGRYVPEFFPPDPYALSNPAATLAHYVDGSGEARNYYFNTLDTSNVRLTDFPAVRQLINEGKPGVHRIVDAAGSFDSGLLSGTRNFSSAATVGGLELRANGILVISKNGRYSFDGRLMAKEDPYDFNARKGRSWIGESSTTIGRHIPGKQFQIYIIGSKPFSDTGPVTRRGR